MNPVTIFSWIADVLRAAGRNLATWPGAALRWINAFCAAGTEPLRRGFAAGLGRGRTAPAPDRAPMDAGHAMPCTGCGQRYRGDQQVPDPRQFDTGDEQRGQIRLVDALMVRCSCGNWFHALQCYSLHRCPAVHWTVTDDSMKVHSCTRHD